MVGFVIGTLVFILRPDEARTRVFYLAFLAFSATNIPEVQEAVVKEAQKNNIPVNSADSPRSSTFHVPARLRRGDFLLTVSTGGGSPALATKIRRDLNEVYGVEYGLYVSLLWRIRRKVVGDGQKSESHKLLFENILQLNILEQIQAEDWTSLRDGLSSLLPDDFDVAGLVGSVIKEHSSLSGKQSER